MGFKDDYYSLEARLNNIAKNEKIKEFVVRKSQNGKRSEGISGGDTYIFTVLPDEYEEAVKLAERINAEKARNKQEDKFNEFMSKQEKNYDELCKPFEEQTKRKIKSKPANNKYKKKKYTLIKKGLSLVLATASILGIGGHLAKQNIDEYNKVAASVEQLTDDEIKKEIAFVLKQEISEATHENIENIDISQYNIGSDTKRTEVKAGESIYTENLNKRDFITYGNTLKSNNIRDIIYKVKNAKNREELIKTLIDARKFSKNKDLKVDGDTLEEVKTKDDVEER